MANKVEIVNKKAKFEYTILDKYEAGIVLTGTEIKSIRQNKASLSDAYCVFKDGELWVKNLHISEYANGTYNNHDPKRDRKLLLHKYQLKRLESKIKESGLTIVPLRLYLNDKGLAKLEIALVRGKKEYDKREAIKKRESERNISKYLKP
ncbi:MAG TPA: SsrA-binding protein SmpB [Bacteroidales bacterium]|jgi:SsrA-binding protein|nr:MAG: SsrA-binding protein [Bacteroidetes bacterium ADurb.Bin035]HCM29307.1 SsrA-binding protein [Bacteroidales bacterium]HNQ20451.1 SsrA-binding protein SmpB [Bacteroidales bacterium]HNT70458.1 SsrA-binding protein SmpB [Bacteroidales bacterium]HNW20374.1 SsrA-binding protein SmpB [Bacteroidales bacterium]